MKLFEIKHRFSGEVLFKLECGSLKACLEAAVKAGARLDGASLDGASLDGASLYGARLGGASLYGASLDGASLGGARLDGASLDGASLFGASLGGASLDGASLDGASLDGARLGGASLDGASLYGASLWGVDLSVAQHIDKIDWGYDQITSIPPLFVVGGRRPVMISDKHIKIGCWVQTTQAWRNATADDLAAGAAERSDTFNADLWARFRDPLLALADAHQSQVAAKSEAAA